MEALIDPDRRKELGGWLLQGASFFAIALLLLALSKGNGQWDSLVLLSAVAIGGWRFWVADRLSPTSSQVYARIMIGENLPGVTDNLLVDSQLFESWRTFAPSTDQIVTLSQEEAVRAGSLLRQIPLKSFRRRAPALTLAWTIASFLLGVILPDLLATLVGVQEVVSGARSAQFQDFLQPGALFVLAVGIFGTVRWRQYVSGRNAGEWTKVRTFMRDDLWGEMRGMTDPKWIGRRHALNLELQLAYRLSRTPDGHLTSAEDPYGIGRTQPIWRQWRLSDADEGSVNNFLLALGVLASLVTAGG